MGLPVLLAPSPVGNLKTLEGEYVALLATTF